MIYSLDDVALILDRCGPMPDELRDAMRAATGSDVDSAGDIPLDSQQLDTEEAQR